MGLLVNGPVPSLLDSSLFAEHDGVPLLRGAFGRRLPKCSFTQKLTAKELKTGDEQGARRPVGAARQMAQNKLADLDTKIATLNAMRASLTRLIATCTRPRSERD